MSDGDTRTTADAKREVSERLLTLAGESRYDGGMPRVDDLDENEELRAFLDRAFEEMADHLADNRASANQRGFSGTEVRDFDAVLDLINDQLSDITVNSGGWHSPAVMVWFSGEIPRWANDAWRAEFRFSVHREHYNGNPAHAVLDARRM